MKLDLGGLIRLQKEQVKSASEVLARAFDDDPTLIRFVAQPRKRQEILRAMFRMVISHAVGHGEVYAVSPKMEGIAVWLPSGAPTITFWEAVRGGGLALIFKGGWDFMRRMKQDEDFVRQLRQRLAPNPHWYLAILGVDPKFQGKGYASRLLKPMLKGLDEEKLPCYLETSIEEYVPIYQRFGFKLIQEAVLPGSDSRMWVMLREKSG
jgi:GNAT superfamily N-acetyltransferase